VSSAPYYFIRYTWISQVDVVSLAKDLASSFEVTELHEPESNLAIVERAKFRVKADTLGVYLSLTKATLYQKEKQPFTEKDVRLRERIFAFYRRNRATPFPWGFMQEPSFDVQNTRKADRD
jgi:hypothetical protein